MDDALWLLSWNPRNGLVPPDRSLWDALRRRRGPAACTDKEHLITGMLPVAAALWDKGYNPFFSSRLAETGATSTSRRGGLLTAVSSKYVAEHEVLSFTDIIPGRAPAVEICTDRGRPHPHQRPRAASRLLSVGGTGGVLGRHTNLCHGTQPRWETPGGHRG